MLTTSWMVEYHQKHPAIRAAEEDRDLCDRLIPRGYGSGITPGALVRYSSPHISNILAATDQLWSECLSP